MEKNPPPLSEYFFSERKINDVIIIKKYLLLYSQMKIELKIYIRLKQNPFWYENMENN